MRKPKYNLSKSGMDNLMDKLTQIAMEESEEVEGLLDTPITTNFVKLMTKVNGLEDVIERNEHLTKHFQGLLSLYGFESMSDMYLYAMSCDIVPEHLTKRKDYSRLVPVKRKIVRNGKEQEITVYEDPNGDRKDSEREVEGGKAPRGRSARGKSTRRHARDLTTVIVGSDKTASTKTVAKLKQAATSLSGGNKPFREDSQFYLTIKDDDGSIAGIVGYSEEGEFLVMDFYRTNGQVSGVAAKGFFELLKLALQKDRGVKVEDNQQARHVFMQSGLEQGEDGYWTITSEDLKSAFGESGSTSG